MKNPEQQVLGWAEKLCLYPGTKVKLVNPPDEYLQLLRDAFPHVHIMQGRRIKKDVIHWFVSDTNSFSHSAENVQGELKKDHPLWLFIPKRTTKSLNKWTTTAVLHGLICTDSFVLLDDWYALKFVSKCS